MKITTTIKDYGHDSEKFGKIPSYYVFKHKLYVKREDIIKSEVQDWCRNNCEGYYRVECYTHMTNEQIFVDKVYLASDNDAALIKLFYDTTEDFIKRPRKPRRRALKNSATKPVVKNPIMVAAGHKAWVTRRARQQQTQAGPTTVMAAIEREAKRVKIARRAYLKSRANQRSGVQKAKQFTPGTIEWTEKTWNSIAGCSMTSPGCSNCYAMTMASRCAAMEQKKYFGTTRKSGGRAVWTGQINFDENALTIPYRWKKPTVIFANSMSDMFHEYAQLDWQKKFLK